jgi:hypothetical protein
MVGHPDKTHPSANKSTVVAKGLQIQTSAFRRLGMGYSVSGKSLTCIKPVTKRKAWSAWSVME